MTIRTPGPPSAQADLSLADLRDRILADPAIPDGRRRALASALRAIGRALGQPLETIPADPVRLRPMLKGVTPAMAKLTAGSWRNALSQLGAALAVVRPDMLPRRFDLAPSPAWADLLERLPKDTHTRFYLGRFARYATRLGLEPEAVDDALIVRYELDLTRCSLTSEPARQARETALRWNAAAERDAAWPQTRLTIADNRVRHSLPWDSYPPSLRQEVDRWLDGLGRDPLALRKTRRLRPASIAARQKQLALYLGALVQAGERPANMTSLAAVVTPDHAERALRLILDRQPEGKTTHAWHVAVMLVTLGRHWLRLGEADIADLSDMARGLAPRVDGLAPSNVARLIQLNDPRRLGAILLLPKQIEERVRRAGPPSVHGARLMQTAVAIEILIMTALRIGNLGDLAIGSSLLLHSDGKVTINVAPERVKNRVLVTADLTGASAALVRRYISHYRPLLGDPKGPWLFPGQRPGTAKTLDALRTQITRAMAEIGGVAWHPHLFRHLLAHIQLNADPGADGIVTRALGHKRSDTTRAHYAGYQTRSAIRRYDELVHALRAKLSDFESRPR